MYKIYNNKKINVSKYFDKKGSAYKGLLAVEIILHYLTTYYCIKTNFTDPGVIYYSCIDYFFNI